MGEERRYSEDEVSEIFALAASAGETTLPALADQEGLTLEELQAVGIEVGLAPERVAEAAATIDARSEVTPRRRLLGAPVSVGRVVELPRAATEREWQFLVAELRDTFHAKGEVTSHGSVREWSNGNLHAVLEQTEAGHRLRLGTRKGSATEVVVSAVALLSVALLMCVAMLATGKTGAQLLIPALIALAGGGGLASNALLLSRWAGERERQMGRIGARARALLEAPAAEE